MFDPTIFENIKIVLEGEIYDLDLSRKITVINRKDLVDLASMSRTFIMAFQLVDDIGTKYVEMELIAKSEDLSKEILEIDDDENKPGCEIKLHLYTEVNSPSDQCAKIEKTIGELWDYRPVIVQKLSYQFRNETNSNTEQNIRYNNHLTLHFERKIDEGNIGDIHELLDLTVRSLEALNTII